MKGKVLHFGPFELDPARQELRRRGVSLRLPVSRIRLLMLLVSHRDTLITREEIAACLWSDEPTVDVMNGINTAVNRLRAHLGDDPASPKYIETMVGAGYRFIADVSEVDANGLPAEAHDEFQTTAAEEAPHLPTVESVPVANRTGVLKSRVLKWTAIAVAALVTSAAVLVYVIQAARSRKTALHTDLQLTRVSSSGDIQFADISPDGKYVAYVRATKGGQSLWLKQLASGRVLQLATIGSDLCPGLAFSPDGNDVYFVRKKPLEPSGELYRVPFLGGSPAKVLDGISGEPAISPDGSKVAFVRSTLSTRGEDSVVTAALNGSGEHVLVSYKAPGIHFDRIAWTADGTTLVYPFGSSKLMTIPAQGGTPHQAKGSEWTAIGDLSGLPPGRDLVVAGELTDNLIAQVFEVSLSTGEIRRITDDLSNYTAVRATADGSSLVTVQDLALSTVQIFKPGAESAIRSLSAESENRDGMVGLSWTSAGKILYASESNQQEQLIEVDSDGANLRILAKKSEQESLSNPVVSPRGDFIAVTQWSHGDKANIWRIDIPSGEEKRLTTGEQDFPPSITPDGRWVIYGSLQGEESVLMKVSSQGGPAVRLTDYNADYPSVSPDGNWIACFRNPQGNQPPSLAILPIAGGPPAKVFPLPETAVPPPLVWTPDGRAVAFINSVDGVGNIWQQPVAGGPAEPVTHFNAGKIFKFDWSRDGRLALSRGTETADAVLIRSFREAGHSQH